MNKRFLFLSVFAVLLVLRASSSCASNPALVTDVSQYKESKFIPYDTAPLFRDFRTVLQLQASSFLVWIFPLLKSDSFDELDETVALSDHYINWEEISIFLTSIGGWFGFQNCLESNAFNYFTHEIFTHLTQKEGGIYEANKTFAAQPAFLPLRVLECYANWREVRYWLYRELRAQEIGAQKGV